MSYFDANFRNPHIKNYHDPLRQQFLPERGMLPRKPVVSNSPLRQCINYQQALLDALVPKVAAPVFAENRKLRENFVHSPKKAIDRTIYPKEAAARFSTTEMVNTNHAKLTDIYKHTLVMIDEHNIHLRCDFMQEKQTAEVTNIKATTSKADAKFTAVLCQSPNRVLVGLTKPSANKVELRSIDDHALDFDIKIPLEVKHDVTTLHLYDANTVLVGTSGGEVAILDLRKKKPTTSTLVENAAICALSAPTEEPYFATASGEKVNIFDMRHLYEAKITYPHTAQVASLAFHPTQQNVIAFGGGSEKSIRIVNHHNDSINLTYQQPQVSGLAWDGDGKTLFTSSASIESPLVFYAFKNNSIVSSFIPNNAAEEQFDMCVNSRPVEDYYATVSNRSETVYLWDAPSLLPCKPQKKEPRKTTISIR